MSLGTLMCGLTLGSGKACQSLDHLSAVVDSFYGKCRQYSQNPSLPDAQLFSPFCGRVVLENSFAALIGRIDPFRILYLSEFQCQAEYDVGKPARSGYHWRGDVIAEEEVSRLWNIDQDKTKISRALFSAHYEELYWRHAIIDGLDYAQQSTHSASLLSEIDPDKYLPRAKGELRRLYSTLSKGVHWDFFNPIANLDQATIASAVEDSLVIISQLGYFSHFIPTSFRKLEPANARDTYIALHEEVSS